MAEETDEIRPEQFQRVTQERDEWKTKAEAMELTVRDTAFLDAAFNHFDGKGIANAYKVATQAVKDATLRDVKTPEELGSALDGWYDGLQQMFTTAAPPPEEQPPVADTAPAPAFARPNPAADGAPTSATSKLIETSSPEFAALSLEEIKQLDKDGSINWKAPLHIAE